MFIRSERMRSGQKWWEKMDLDFSSVQGLSKYLCVRVCVWEGVKKKASDRKKELVCCQTVDRTTWDSYNPAGHKSQLCLIKKLKVLKTERSMRTCSRCCSQAPTPTTALIHQPEPILISAPPAPLTASSRVLLDIKESQSSLLSCTYMIRDV